MARKNLIITSIGGVALFVLGLAQDSTSRPEPPTYHSAIAPLVAKHCTPCHFDGGPAPFTFNSYEEVKKNLALIRIQLLSRAMPPIAERSDFGVFTLTPTLTDEQLVAFQKWMQAGTPIGQPTTLNRASDSPRPEIKTLSVSGPPVELEGAPYWKSFEVTIPESGYLTFLELAPGVAPALRSASITLTDANGKVFRGTWAFGYPAISTSDGEGISVPAGTKVKIDALLYPTGKPDSSRFDLRYAIKEEAQPLTSVQLERTNFVIPANKNEVLTLEHRFDTDVVLHSLVPEAMFYCTRVTIRLKTPDSDQSKILFETLRWNPYQVGNYQFAKPVAIPAGSVLEAQFQYDNDEKCAMNEGKTPAPIHSGSTIENEKCRLTLIQRKAASES